MKPEYDMSIHTNPDAQAWAKLFCEKYKVWSKDGVEADTEGLMIGWFANAMMAMHDHLVLKGAPINGDHAAFLLETTTPQQVQPASTDKHWCETCDGGGTIDETLGGEHFSNPKAECPDCDGNGYWIRRSQLVKPAPPIAAQPERTLLEEHDLNQLPGYHQGRADGRALGYDVGYRHAIEHIAQPVIPYAYAVYFPEMRSIELVHDLEDLCEAMTNNSHVVTPLYDIAQPVQPAPPTLEQLEFMLQSMVTRKEIIWSGFRKDADGRYTIPVISKSDYKFALAAIEHFSQPVQPASTKAAT